MLKAGVIGCGGRGRAHAQGYQLSPEVEIVACADPVEDSRKAFTEQFEVERGYTHYREMLEKANLDLVSVGPRWIDCHAEMVIACAEAGVRGIFCEKPFAKTLAEADAMIDACDRNGAKIAVAHRRASGYEQYAKKLVEAGEIGEIQVMRGHGKDDHRPERWI